LSGLSVSGDGADERRHPCRPFSVRHHSSCPRFPTTRSLYHHRPPRSNPPDVSSLSLPLSLRRRLKKLALEE
jgi:hypothetical protein